MTRIEFTKQICQLILEMVDVGERPLMDFLKRSDEEQHRLFKLGLSKCDGYKITSQHQRGKALDIYFMNDAGYAFDENGEAIPPKKGWEYWHQEWEKAGGKVMLSWDKGHFEG